MKAIPTSILLSLVEYSVKTPLPGYVRQGHQSRLQVFKTSFGLVCHRRAQVRNPKGRVLHPLEARFCIVLLRQNRGRKIDAAVGQAIHYRVAVREMRRLKSTEPSKSMRWRRFQHLSETTGAWPSLRQRPFRFLMADEASVHLQKRGFSLEKTEIRWALAAEEVSQQFELVGFWIDMDWAAIRQDLERRLNYHRLQMLSDGEPGIEENLLSSEMELRRFVLHGRHDFSFLLYADGVKGKAQKLFWALLDQNLLFHFCRANLEMIDPSYETLFRKIVQKIRLGFFQRVHERSIILILEDMRFHGMTGIVVGADEKRDSYHFGSCVSQMFYRGLERMVACRI